MTRLSASLRAKPAPDTPVRSTQLHEYERSDAAGAGGSKSYAGYRSWERRIGGAIFSMPYSR